MIEYEADLSINVSLVGTLDRLKYLNNEEGSWRGRLLEVNTQPHTYETFSSYHEVEQKLISLQGDHKEYDEQPRTRGKN